MFLHNLGLLLHKKSTKRIVNVEKKTVKKQNFFIVTIVSRKN